MRIPALAVAALFLLQQDAQIRSAVLVTPDTVTVGTPFRMLVRVVAPSGSVIRFPPGPDTTSTVRLLDPVSVSTSDSGGTVVRTATYRLAAWDVRRQPIRVGDVEVETQRGTSRVSLNGPAVTVLSVLPQDSSQHDPRPARDLFGGIMPWWYPWLPLLILAAMLAAIFIWWWKRRRLAVALPGALQVAERELARIDSMRLLEAGEHGRHVVLVVEALRGFLAARFSAVRLSDTSAEILEALDLPPRLAAKVANVLGQADEAKFAETRVSAAAAAKLAIAVREIVREIGDPPPPTTPEERLAEAA